MKFIRRHKFSRIFTLLTAMVFLNMGFFVAELKVLELDMNKDLVENLAELILNVGMEEERDVCDELPEEKAKTFDDFFDTSCHSTDSMLYVISHLRKRNRGDDAVPLHVLDKVTPPPKA